jgi:hypothetical protein
MAPSGEEGLATGKDPLPNPALQKKMWGFF